MTREQKTAMYAEYGASSTSFYTTTEKKDSYESLDSILEAKCKDEKVRQVIKDMLEVCADITEALRTALVTVEGSMNDFGDAQLSVDVSSYRDMNPSSDCDDALTLEYRSLPTISSGTLSRPQR